MHAVIFSPIQFLCILLLEEQCVQGQALQQRGPGPSKGAQVPACLTGAKKILMLEAIQINPLNCLSNKMVLYCLNCFNRKVQSLA